MKLRGEKAAANDRGARNAHNKESAGLGAATHLDERGNLRMVDIGGKRTSRRLAIARGIVKMRRETLQAIIRGELSKGEALAAARVAGIIAAKRTQELIPLCHQIPLDHVNIDFREAPSGDGLEIESVAVARFRTGVEMEALVAVSVAALTIYDMAKALDRAMTIDAIRLIEKRGGRSGRFRRADSEPFVSIPGR